MSEVEPDGCEPYEVDNGVDGAREGLLNPEGTVRCVACVNHVGEQFGKHHVVPEVVEVEEQTEHYDNTEHEHVLRSPFHLSRTVGHCIAAGTTRLAVLHRENKSINEVKGYQRSQAEGCCHSIPVSTQHLADGVVRFC